MVWKNLVEILAIIFILASLFFPGVDASTALSSPEVTVIFQFGNQEVLSTNVYLPLDNETAFEATVLACENLGLYLNYSWSSYGAWINQIGWEANDWYVSGYYWHLLVWSNDSYEWEMSSVGASSLNLSNGDIIAWVYTVDNPSYVPYTYSIAYPGHYNVWGSPRGNENNTGIARGGNYYGSVMWKFEGESSWGFSSTPIAGDGMIFIADSSALYALNLNGSLIWSNSDGAAGYYGIASPVLFGNYVIIGTSDNYLRAFYVNNGTLAWQFYLGEDVTSAPVVDIVNKIPTVFVATFSLGSPGKLYAIDLLDGTQKWNLTLMGSNYFGIPAIYDGKIIVPIAGIEDSSYVWNPPYGLQCIDEDGTFLWNYTTSSSVRSSPAVENGNIYFTTTGGKLLSLDMNGTERWSIDIGASVSSPAVKNGKIYVGNNNGTLYGVEDDGSYASILWSDKLNGPIQGGITYVSGIIIAVTNTQNGTVYATYSNGTPYWGLTIEPENYILSSPIIADSYLLVASNNGYLYALGNNVTYPKIGDIIQGSAYTGMPIEISFESPLEYQAVLYYKNITGDRYHAVWMNYSDGAYVGYIPPQNSPGDVYYYITLVNATGVSVTSDIRIAQVSQPVPEFNSIALLPLILLAALIIKLKNRARG